MGTVTESIAELIVNTRYDRIPEQAVQIVKRAIIDSIGVSLSACATPEGKIATEYVREIGGTPEAVVIGGGFKAPAMQAAFANGVLAAALDYGDTSLTWGVGHPSQAMLSAILALGEKQQITGQQAIEAYIIGFEVGSRIGSGFTRHYDLGWHTTATVGTLAAAAAAAKILNLDIYQSRMALGIAGSTASGLKRQFGSMGTAFNSGKAARDGVVAASLAKKGYTSNADILEGDNGLARLLTEGRFDLANMRRKPNSWDILSPGGLYLKAYPCCHLTQWCIGAMFYLVNEHSIKFNDVAEVTGRIPAFFIPTLCSNPKTGKDALRSMEYCLTAVLLDGKIDAAEFTDEKLSRAEVQQFMKRVKLIPFEGAQTIAESMKQPETVSVRLKNGKEYRREVTFPKGDTLRDPMTDEEITSKFYSCARGTLGEKKLAKVLELAWNLDSLPKISELTSWLISK